MDKRTAISGLMPARPFENGRQGLAADTQRLSRLRDAHTEWFHTKTLDNFPGVGRIVHSHRGDLCSAELGADDLIQPFEDLSQLLKAHFPKSLANPFHRQRAYLADLNP